MIRHWTELFELVADFLGQDDEVLTEIMLQLHKSRVHSDSMAESQKHTKSQLQDGHSTTKQYNFPNHDKQTTTKQTTVLATNKDCQAVNMTVSAQETTLMEYASANVILEP